MGAGKGGTLAVAVLAEADLLDFLDFDVSSMASLLLVFRKFNLTFAIFTCM